MSNSEISRVQEPTPRSDKVTRLVGRCRTQIYRCFGHALPQLALVLGSGFQDVIREFELQAEINFVDLPGFPQPTVAGHAGKLALATLEGLPLLVCSGRAHFYEGHSMEAVMFATRVLAHCGVRELILTNAAGGINARYQPGDFMAVADHINFTGVNPLRGVCLPGNARFVDLSRAYDAPLRAEFLRAARQVRARMHSGVYIGVSGPSYETPAEIRAFRRLGADAVGMSTIPEVLMSRALNLRVAAISCITNRAADSAQPELSHEEVLRAGRANTATAVRILKCFAQHRVRQERFPRNNLKIESPKVGSAEGGR